MSDCERLEVELRAAYALAAAWADLAKARDRLLVSHRTGNQRAAGHALAAIEKAQDRLSKAQEAPTP